MYRPWASSCPVLRPALGTGLGVPKGTPAEIIDTLNKEINAALADPAIKSHFANLGLTGRASSPAEFSKLIVDETEKWANVIRAAHIKA